MPETASMSDSVGATLQSGDDSTGRELTAAADGVNRGWNFPKSSLMNENPANSSWLIALMTAASTGVRDGSSDVKSLSKLAVSVRFFWNK